MASPPKPPTMLDLSPDQWDLSHWAHDDRVERFVKRHGKRLKLIKEVACDEAAMAHFSLHDTKTGAHFHVAADVIAGDDQRFGKAAALYHLDCYLAQAFMAYVDAH